MASDLPAVLPPSVLQFFPFLERAGYTITSRVDRRYNCVAWAAGDDARWWWPTGYYWPDGLNRQSTVAQFVQVFESLGYGQCPNGQLEANHVKIAIYASASGEPTHAARQLPDGAWTSKLGRSYDITHPTPEAVGGPAYGNVAQFLRRRVPTNGEQIHHLTIS